MWFLLKAFSLILLDLSKYWLYGHCGERWWWCKQTGSFYIRISSCLAKLLSHSRRAYFSRTVGHCYPACLLHLPLWSDEWEETFFGCLRKIWLHRTREKWGCRKMKEENKQKPQDLGLGENRNEKKRILCT